jgi:hypothetical protein
VQADSFGRFHLHNGVISRHNRLHKPFYSYQRIPINIGIAWREARCGAVCPGTFTPVLMIRVRNTITSPLLMHKVALTQLQ